MDIIYVILFLTGYALGGVTVILVYRSLKSRLCPYLDVVVEKPNGQITSAFGKKLKKPVVPQTESDDIHPTDPPVRL